jgi:DMSO/TMAO reductase YedYZ molybdopterin-dependent catalytic subunit
VRAGAASRLAKEAAVGLFLVRHQHEPARCPAGDADIGAMLLNYLSRPNVRAHGVTIQSEAVVHGEHTLFMIVEASDAERVRSFMAPFEDAGSVDVFPASTCVRVVASGGCGAPLPGVDEAGVAIDPEEACHEAIEEGLVVHRAHPLNCETSIPALIGGVVMPNAHFYVRNHFHIPKLDPATWRLTVGGLVERPLSLSLRDLTTMRSEAMVVTLECAGNGRDGVEPRVDGEQWRMGAVSTAEWTGVPLVEVLDRAGIRSDASELVFRGADRGHVDGKGTIGFERSLPVDTARGADALLAYAMNGEPLPLQHGYPVRLVVPSWYGVASVKWLAEIEAVAEPFTGYFQHDKYWFETPRDGGVVRDPVSLQRVRALITEPSATEPLECGDIAVRGVAWSGAAPIARVEVAVDGGPWQEARLIGDRHRHSWQWWELMTRIDRTGAVTIRCRATDLAGRAQPEAPEWNRFGYGNNSIQTITLQVGTTARA